MQRLSAFVLAVGVGGDGRSVWRERQSSRLSVAGSGTSACSPRARFTGLTGARRDVRRESIRGVRLGRSPKRSPFTLYDISGNVVYTDGFAEKYSFPANSVFTEEFCTSLLNQQSGFYQDVYEGVDDLGNRRAFTRVRLRLIAVPGASAVSDAPAQVTSQPIVRRTRQRIR